MKRGTKFVLLGAVVIVGLLVVAFTTLSGGLAIKEDTKLVESLVFEGVDQKSDGEVPAEETKVIATESDFMEVIHHMTHQKVAASPKWGAVQITEKRIDEMLKVLDINELENEEFYRETLDAWKNGDFSNAVAVHNKIWGMQGGTIGEATKLLNAEEEKKYIEKYFE